MTQEPDKRCMNEECGIAITSKYLRDPETCPACGGRLELIPDEEFRRVPRLACAMREIFGSKRGGPASAPRGRR